MDWVKFEPRLGVAQQLPPEGKPVLAQVVNPNGSVSFPLAVVVGHWIRSDTAQTGMAFVTPGVGRQVHAWCDCLPQDFSAPNWPKRNAPTGEAAHDGIQTIHRVRVEFHREPDKSGQIHRSAIALCEGRQLRGQWLPLGTHCSAIVVDVPEDKTAALSVQAELRGIVKNNGGTLLGDEVELPAGA